MSSRVYKARILSMARWSVVRVLIPIGLMAMVSPTVATPLDPPSLRCASVNLTGVVTLSWVAPPDPGGEFAEYQIWHSASQGGPYSLITSIPVYGTPSYPDPGAGANSGPQFYYMTTVNSAAEISITSDTLSTIFLTVGQSTPLGSAVLDWTAQHTPPLSTAAAQYVVQMEYPIGTWTTIDLVGVDTLELLHEITICDDSLTFRVALANDLGCVSYSNRIGDHFSDVTPPSPPVMITVSVDTSSGQSTLSWNPSPQPDTDGYIIVYTSSSGNTIIDTVFGQFNTFYQWVASMAGSYPESFTLAAFDTCFSGTPPSPNTSATLPSHTTLHCTTDYDKCTGRITIEWTPYVGWPVNNYELYAQQDGGAVYLLATLPGSTTSYVHIGVDPFGTYCYVVKAIGAGAGQVSLSNKHCRLTDYPPVPQYNYVRTVTVATADDILVEDSVDMSAEVQRYHIERSANGEPFAEVAVIGGGAGPVIQWHDLDVKTDERSYRYRVLVDDSCGNQVITSNEGGSIYLRTSADLSGFNHLTWNGYEDWAGVVSGYAIYRAVGTDPEALITVNAPGDWSYSDDVSALYTSNGRFCYRVEALEAANPAGIDAVSSSNVSCAIQQEQVWIPNAFIAGSPWNSQFKPVIAYVDFNNYEFTIINRWGQVIWTTDDPEEAWDGMINGNYVPQGVYAYYCAFNNGAGQEFTERGTVTFLYAVEN